MNEKDLIKKALSENVSNKDFIYNCVLNEMENKARSGVMKIRRVFFMVAIAATLSITAFAGMRLLSAEQVAQYLDEVNGEETTVFSQLFTDGLSVEVNQTHTDANYRVTFLGFAHGSDIKHDGEYGDETYVVTAIENNDGSPIDENNCKLLSVSPLVNGLNPVIHNMWTFGTVASGDIIDGVLYQLFETKNIEFFSDEKLYLAVCEDFITPDKYNFDEKSGKITVNEDFDGLNMLFELPIDAKKADKAKVEKYLAGFDNSNEEELSKENEKAEQLANSRFENYEEAYNHYLETGMNEKDAEIFAERAMIYENWNALSMEEKIAVAEDSSEYISKINDKGEFEFYWADGSYAGLTTSVNSPIGEKVLISYGDSVDEIKYIYYEKISETELKFYAYTASVENFK